MDNSFWVNYGEYIVGIPALIISTILAIIAIVISLKQWNKKKLEYRIIANESLLSYHSDSNDNLIINFKDKKINNLTLLHIEFENTGNKEILRSDFDSNLVIDLDEYTHIYKVAIENPDKLDLKIDYKEHSIEIFPVLINPRDRFSLKVLMDKEFLKYTISSRIAGIKKVIEKKEEYDVLYNRAFPFIAINLFLAMLVALIYPFTKCENYIIYNTKDFTLFLFIVSIFIFSFATILKNYFFLLTRKKKYGNR